jgi:hypothetical protein
MRVGMRGSVLIRRVAFSEPPAAAAAVMATGVLSLCFDGIGLAWLAYALLALATAQWCALVLVFALDAAVDPPRWRREVDVPAALALVAGTAVLGTAAVTVGATVAAAELLALATSLWLLLLPRVLRQWHAPGAGSGFLVCVSTQSLAVLAARQAAETDLPWLAGAAGATFFLGLALYALAAARFDWRQILQAQGDQWVSGGALAISSLAASALLTATQTPTGVLHVVALTLWWAAAATYLPLTAAEIVHPRLHYHRERWSTVFPLGMVAQSALFAGAPGGLLHTTGTAFSWLALALWLPVATAAATRSAHTLTHRPRNRA